MASMLRASHGIRNSMTIKRVWPHQVGYLRRPELDTETIEVWELPDGRLLAHRKIGPPLEFEVVRYPKSFDSNGDDVK